MSEHIKVPQEDDDKINRTLRENLPDNINEVDLGSKDQKGKHSSLLSPSFPSQLYHISYLDRSILTRFTGLLSFLGDPLGKGLQKGLSPVGNLVGGTGDRMAGFTKQDQPKKGEAYEKFGGKEQNGQNPLGL